MFSGIVEVPCPVQQAARRDGCLRLWLDLGPLRGGPSGGGEEPDEALVREGDSLAVNGACLTVAERRGERAAFDVVPETLRLTNLGALRPGDLVNVERALRYGARVDGHLVQGHVEGTGEVLRREHAEGEVRLTIHCGRAFARRMLPKGSVAVDGVSLTVATLDEESFSVVLVPHTLQRTNLDTRRPGDRVNLEPDLFGSWILRAVELLRADPPEGGGQSGGERTGPIP